jgi:hypothetical protein
MFDDPPIALHHDFDQAPFDASVLPHNVHVVQNWNKTDWGGSSVFDANLKALRLLYAYADPDWVISLSNACYPIKTADHILEFLARSTTDGYMEYRLIAYDPVRDRTDRDKLSRADRWLFSNLERYIAVRVSSYKVMALLRQPNRAVYLKHPFLTRWLTPFRGRFRCFAGATWYTVNRRAAHVLLKDTPFSRDLRLHYRKRMIVDESFYQTIMLNEPGLTLHNFSLTYTDWTEDKPHPKILSYEDFPSLHASDRLFARKWPHDENLLRALDEQVDSYATKNY